MLTITKARLRSIALACAPLLLAACAHTQPAAGSAASATTAAPSAAPARIPGKEFVYTDGTTEMKGYIAYPASDAPRPAVLVVHEWWGLNDYARARAEQLAAAGYVALAVDMYGAGKNSAHAADAKAFMEDALKNQDEAKGRYLAALDALASDPRVDREKIASVGYCFGGAVSLAMARAGTDLDLVATFHGSLGTDKPMAPGAFKGKIFVAHGDADSFVPPDVVAKFRAEMDAAGANYEFVSYPGAKHGFTNPGADALGQQNQIPIGYDAAADHASWQRLLELLAAM